MKPGLASGTLDTALFTDGLKRVLETKKDATVDPSGSGAAQDVMAVSGRVVFDALGRTVSQHYPVTEPLGQAGAFNPSFDTVAPTTMAYDVLDRVTRTTLPDGTATSLAYGFGPDRAGLTQFETVSPTPTMSEKNESGHSPGRSTLCRARI